MNPDILKRLEQADAAAKAVKVAPTMPVAVEVNPERPAAAAPPILGVTQAPAKPKVAAPKAPPRGGIQLTGDQLAGLITGAPLKDVAAQAEADLERDLQNDLELKKFYDAAKTSIDVADAARAAGVQSLPEYRRQAETQGVSLDDIVRQAQRGVSFEEYARIAGNQIPFLPAAARRAKFEEQSRKYEQATRGEIDLEDVKLAPPAKESGLVRGYIVGYTTPEELPEAAKPGDVAYATAERLIQTLSERPDWVHRFDAYRNRASGNYSAQWVNDEEKALADKIDPNDPEFEQKLADARRRAFMKIVAAKTIGFWAPPIFVKKEELEKGEVPGVLSAMAPGNVEVVGFDKDGRILYRSESTMGYVLRALDIASVVPGGKKGLIPLPGQAVVTGLATKSENESIGEAIARGIKTGSNWAEYAMDRTESDNFLVRGAGMGFGLAAAMAHPDAITGTATLYTKGSKALSEFRGRRFTAAAEPLLASASEALQAGDYDKVRENLAKFRTLAQDYSPAGKTNYADILSRADASFIEGITLADPAVKSLDPRLSEQLLGVLGDVPGVRDLVGKLAVVGDPHLHFSRSSREAAARLGKQAEEATEGTGATFETYLNAGNYGRRRELVEQAKRLYELNAPKTVEEAAARTVDGKIITLDSRAEARSLVGVPDAARDAAFEREMSRILQAHRDGLIAGDVNAYKAVEKAMEDSPIVGRDAAKSLPAGTSAEEIEKYEKAATEFRRTQHASELPQMRGRVASVLASGVEENHKKALQLFDQAIASTRANEASLDMAIEYMRRELGRRYGVAVTPREVQYQALPFAAKSGELSPPAYAFFANYRARFPDVDPEDVWEQVRVADQTFIAKADHEGRSIHDIWAESGVQVAPKSKAKPRGKPPATPTTVAPPGTPEAAAVAAVAATPGKVVHPAAADVAATIKADSGLDIPEKSIDTVLKAVDKLAPGAELKRPVAVSKAHFGAVAEDLVRRDMLVTDGKTFTKPEAMVPVEAAAAKAAPTPVAETPEIAALKKAVSDAEADVIRATTAYTDATVANKKPLFGGRKAGLEAAERAAEAKYNEADEALRRAKEALKKAEASAPTPAPPATAAPPAATTEAVAPVPTPAPEPAVERAAEAAPAAVETRRAAVEAEQQALQARLRQRLAEDDATLQARLQARLRGALGPAEGAVEPVTEAQRLAAQERLTRLQSRLATEKAQTQAQVAAEAEARRIIQERLRPAAPTQAPAQVAAPAVTPVPAPVIERAVEGAAAATEVPPGAVAKVGEADFKRAESLEKAGFTDKLTGSPKALTHPDYPGLVFKFGAKEVEFARKYPSIVTSGVEATDKAGRTIGIMERVRPLNTVTPDEFVAAFRRDFPEIPEETVRGFLPTGPDDIGPMSDYFAFPLALRTAKNPSDVLDLMVSWQHPITRKGVEVQPGKWKLATDPDAVVDTLRLLRDNEKFAQIAGMARAENALWSDIFRVDNMGLDAQGRIKILDVERAEDVFSPPLAKGAPPRPADDPAVQRVVQRILEAAAPPAAPAGRALETVVSPQMAETARRIEETGGALTRRLQDLGAQKRGALRRLAAASEDEVRTVEAELDDIMRQERQAQDQIDALRREGIREARPETAIRRAAEAPAFRAMTEPERPTLAQRILTLRAAETQQAQVESARRAEAVQARAAAGAAPRRAAETEAASLGARRAERKASSRELLAKLEADAEKARQMRGELRPAVERMAEEAPTSAAVEAAAVERAAEEAAPAAAKAEEAVTAAPAQPTGITPVAEAPAVAGEITRHAEAVDRLRRLTHQVEVPTFVVPRDIPEPLQVGVARVYGTLDEAGNFVPSMSVRVGDVVGGLSLDTLTRNLYDLASGAGDAERAEATEILRQAAEITGETPSTKPFKGEMYAGRADKAFGTPVTFKSIYTQFASPSGPPAPVTAKVAAPRAMTAQNLNRALIDFMSGKTRPAAFVAQVDAVAEKAAEAFVARKYNRETSTLVRGADMIRERLINARRRRILPDQTVELALWLIDKNPFLADDLSVLVKERALSKGGAQVAGEYDPIDRVVRIFSAPDTPADTAVHEILHHTERMMPVAIQRGIVREWAGAVMRAMVGATPDQQRLLGLMFMQDPKYSDEIFGGFETGILTPSEHYHLVNPSEFWAVNAASILAGRRAAEMAKGASGWVARARQWLSEFVQKARATFNLPSQAPVIRGLEDVLRGLGNPVSDMLTRNNMTLYAVKETPEAGMDAAKLEAAEAVAKDTMTPRPLLAPEDVVREVEAAEAALAEARIGGDAEVIARAEAELSDAKSRLADIDRELDASAESVAAMEAAIDESRAAAEAGRPVPSMPAAAAMRRVILVSDEPGAIVRAAVRYLTDEALNAEDVADLARLARSRGVDVDAEYGRFVGSEENVAKAYEVVADAFVDYLSTAKPPHAGLASTFDYMRDAFSRTYKSTLAGAGGEAVSPRVRAAFERLLPATPIKPKGVFEDFFTQLTTRDASSRGALRVLSDEAVRRGIANATVEKLQETLTDAAKDVKRKGVLPPDTTLIEFPVPVLGREKWTVDDLAVLQERIDTDARALARASDLQFDVLGRPVETTVSEKLLAYAGRLTKSGETSLKQVGKSAVAMNIHTFLGGSVVNATEGMRMLSPELRRDVETLARHTLNVTGDAAALLTEAVNSGDMRPLIGFLSGENLVFTGVTERGAGRRVLTSGKEYTTGFLSLFRNAWDALDEKERNILTRMTVAVNSKYKDFDPKLMKRLRELREDYDLAKTGGSPLKPAALSELKSLEEKYAEHMVGNRSPSEAIVAMMFPENTSNLPKAVIVAQRRKAQDLLNGALRKMLDVKTGEADTVASSLGRAIGDIIGRGKEASFNDYRIVESILYAAGKTERNSALFDGTVFEATQSLLQDTARIVGGTGRTAQAGDEAARRMGVLIAGFGSAVYGKLELIGLKATLTEDEFKAFSAWSLGRNISPDMRSALARVTERFGLNVDFVQETMLGADVYIPSPARKMILDSVARSVYRDLTTVGLAEEAMRTALVATKKRMTRGNLVLRPRYFNVNTVDHFFQMSLITGTRNAAASASRLAFQTLMTTRFGNLFALLVDRPAHAVLRATKRVARTEAFGKAFPRAAEAIEELSPVLPWYLSAEKIRDSLSSAGDRVAQWMSLSKYRIEVNKILDGRDEVMVIGERAYNMRRVREIFSGEGVFSAWDTRRMGGAIRREGVMTINEAGQLVRTSYAKGGEVGVDVGATMLRVSDAANEWVFGGFRNAVDDLADAWSERERVGAAVTLMEAGMDPRVAARLVIDALYDYGQSMTTADRNILVQVLFPFWAFQKNSNAQFLNSLLSPRTAFRMQMWLKFRYRATEMATRFMFNDTGGELGIDVDSMPVEAQQLYYAIMTKAHEKYGPVLPANVALGLRMILTGDPQDTSEGAVYQIDPDLARGFGEILGPETQSAQMLFARYRMTPPTKSGLPTFLRDRPGIGVARRRNAYTALYSSIAGQDDMFIWYALPEASVESSMRFAAHQFFVQLAATEGLLSLANKDITMTPQMALNLIKPIVDIERSPVVGGVVSLYAGGQGYPQRLHPLVAAQLESAGMNLIRVPADSDPFSDGSLLLNIEEAQTAAAASGEGFDPTELLGQDRVKKIRELNESDLQPSELVGVRYYLPPGMPSLMFENSGALADHALANVAGAAYGAYSGGAGAAMTLGSGGQLYEINRLLLDMEERPYERASVYGNLMYAARFFAGADVYEVSPQTTSRREEPMFTKKTPEPQ